MWPNLLEGRELVAIRPRGSVFSLGKQMAEVGGSELFPKESLGEPALCLLRSPGIRPAKARPPGQSRIKVPAESCRDHDNKPMSVGTR